MRWTPPPPPTTLGTRLCGCAAGRLAGRPAPALPPRARAPLPPASSDAPSLSVGAPPAPMTKRRCRMSGSRWQPCSCSRPALAHSGHPNPRLDGEASLGPPLARGLVRTSVSVVRSWSGSHGVISSFVSPPVIKGDDRAAGALQGCAISGCRRHIGSGPRRRPHSRARAPFGLRRAAEARLARGAPGVALKLRSTSGDLPVSEADLDRRSRAGAERNDGPWRDGAGRGGTEREKRRRRCCRDCDRDPAHLLLPLPSPAT